jgi:hypothetical protein
MRKLALLLEEKASMPVLGGVSGPQKVARQCICSGVYLRNLVLLSLSSSLLLLLLIEIFD